MTTPGLEDGERDFFSHFEELRSRILYALLAAALGIVAGWFLYPYAYELLAGPILAAVKARGGQVITLQPAEALFAQMKLALVLGLVLASPFVLWQLWAFVRPGLKPEERRAVRPLLPAVCLLFLFGAAIAYITLPKVMQFFLSFVPGRVEANVTFQQSIDLPLKIIVAFGIAFQMPIVLLALMRLGLLAPRTLLAQWRAAVLILGILSAVITPTGDPLSWSLMMAPLTVLYFGTVLLGFRLSSPRGNRGSDPSSTPRLGPEGTGASGSNGGAPSDEGAAASRGERP